MDATQSVGKVPVDLSKLKVDLMSSPAIMNLRPMGIGALYVRQNRVSIEAQMRRWSRARYAFPVLAVHQIVSVWVKLTVSPKKMAAEAERLSALRMRLWNGIKRYRRTYLNRFAGTPRIFLTSVSTMLKVNP